MVLSQRELAMVKQILFVSLIFSGLSAQAARTINITMAPGAKEISLSNPSSAAVNYTVTCFNKEGVATLAATTSTLAMNKSETHETGSADAGTCTAGAASLQTYTDKNGKKVYQCAGSNAYANAADACGAGQKFCYPPAQYPGCSLFVSNNVWIKADGSMEASVDYGCTYSAVAAGYYPYGGASCSDYVRKVGAGSEALFSVGVTNTGSTPRGAFCCEDVSAGGICKVTINTTGNVFLSSPSFKGGAPF